MNQEAIAINGAKPIRNTWLPYAHQQIDESDIQSVVETLRADRITSGPAVDKFEKDLAEFVGARFAVAFSSGTAALHASVFAAQIGRNDEAITTPLTFCATANCLLYQGAEPVFADVDSKTLNISPEAVVKKITSKTRAILPVDYAGQPADLDALLKIAKQNNLVVIEDASHAIGAEYRGRRVGTVSDMTVFSFHPVKHITTGEGGMVTTDDSKLTERLRLFRNHGIVRDPAKTKMRPWYYEMVELGWNYRISDIACSLGSSQLKRLEQNISRRSEIAARYDSELKGLPGILKPHVEHDVKSVWHLYPIRIDEKLLGLSRETMVRALHAENIGVQVHYIPVYRHPYYRQRFKDLEGVCPVAEAASDSILSLPLFSSMTDQDTEDVIQALHKVVREFQAHSAQTASRGS